MKTFYALGLLSIALYAVVVPAHATSTSAAVGFGHLFYNDNIVRAVVTPVAIPNQGTGQIRIAGVAPGGDGYHGGH